MKTLLAVMAIAVLAGGCAAGSDPGPDENEPTSAKTNDSITVPGGSSIGDPQAPADIRGHIPTGKAEQTSQLSPSETQRPTPIVPVAPPPPTPH
jgi:hypothetical protein